MQWIPMIPMDSNDSNDSNDGFQCIAMISMDSNGFHAASKIYKSSAALLHQRFAVHQHAVEGKQANIHLQQV